MTTRDNDDRDGQDSFEFLLDSYDEYDLPQRGTIRPAVILQIRKSEIVVDLGAKRDGLITENDLNRLPPGYLETLSVGDEIPVYVRNPNDRDDYLLVSLNLGLQEQDWVHTRELLESGEVVEAQVSGYNRGGVLVQYGRLEGFVPYSHFMDIDQGVPEDTRSTLLDQMKGQTLSLKIIEVDQSRRRLILSQREAQREWRAQQKAHLLKSLTVGSVVKGRVTGIRDFGVFVNLGGADGLIHISELAWHRVPHPNDLVEVGAEIDVFVLSLDEEKQRIALSLRRLREDPWVSVTDRYQIGQVVEGEVSNVVDFGAFVVLEDGIEGLLHLTEMADGTLTEPHSYLQRGDTVSVQIARIEPGKRRVGFTQQGMGLKAPGGDALDSPEPDQAVEPQAEAPLTPQPDDGEIATQDNSGDGEAPPEQHTNDSTQ